MENEIENSSIGINFTDTLENSIDSLRRKSFRNGLLVGIAGTVILAVILYIIFK